MKHWLLTLLAVAAPTAVWAADPLFRWQTGQMLTYKVQQVTTATEVVEGKTLETVSKLALIKRWQIAGVDAAGVATLQMSLAALRMENKSPSGEVYLFDNSDPAKSHPQLKDELTKYLGVPLTIVRLDSRGQLVEVKESKFGPASRLEADLPFKMVLPKVPFAQAATWERPFVIKLDPPQGAGETYQAVQKLTCKSITNGQAVIAISTSVTNPPAAIADSIPLLPLQPDGEVVFDITAGRLKSVKFKVAKELPGHRGEGSSYKYTSDYSEEYVGNQ